ncbi:hypothetical protein FPQ18DRAFT_306227 [Pyronema domesticum]|nr:hypothetical protein FPQ18DRAFT_306227 [Pyronema domesticum]
MVEKSHATELARGVGYYCGKYLRADSNRTLSLNEEFTKLYQALLASLGPTTLSESLVIESTDIMAADKRGFRRHTLEMAFNKMFSRLVAKFRPSPTKSCQSNSSDNRKAQNGSGLPHCGHGEFSKSDDSLVPLLSHNEDIYCREIDSSSWPSGLIEWSTTPSEYEASIALKNDPTFPASPMGDVLVRIGLVRSHALPFPHALWRLTRSDMKPLAGIEDRLDSQASYIQAISTESLLEGKASCITLAQDQYLTAPLPEEKYCPGVVGECGRCLGCGFQVPRDLVVVGEEVQHLLPASALHLRGALENRVTWATEVLLAIGDIQYRQDRELYWEDREVLYIQESCLWESLDGLMLELDEFPVHFILEALPSEMAMDLRDKCEGFQSLLDSTARPLA